MPETYLKTLPTESPSSLATQRQYSEVTHHLSIESGSSDALGILDQHLIRLYTEQDMLAAEVDMESINLEMQRKRIRDLLERL